MSERCCKCDEWVDEPFYLDGDPWCSVCLGYVEIL